MARPPSVRRPTLEAYSLQSARILARVKRDVDKADLYRKFMNEDDPKHQAILAQLEEKAQFTEKEEATLLNAATVAQKLERVADNEKDDEKVPAAKRTAAAEALEAMGPKPTAPASASGEDEGPH